MDEQSHSLLQSKSSHLPAEEERRLNSPATKMKTAVIIASAAGLAAAQFSYNETTGKYTCAQPNQAYCVAGSMESNIILRCDSKAIGQPGNCNDVSFNLPHLSIRD